MPRPVILGSSLDAPWSPCGPHVVHMSPVLRCFFSATEDVHVAGPGLLKHQGTEQLWNPRPCRYPFKEICQDLNALKPGLMDDMDHVNKCIFMVHVRIMQVPPEFLESLGPTSCACHLHLGKASRQQQPLRRLASMDRSTAAFRDFSIIIANLLLFKNNS